MKKKTQPDLFPMATDSVGGVNPPPAPASPATPTPSPEPSPDPLNTQSTAPQEAPAQDVTSPAATTARNGDAAENDPPPEALDMDLQDLLEDSLSVSQPAQQTFSQAAKLLRGFADLEKTQSVRSLDQQLSRIADHLERLRIEGAMLLVLTHRLKGGLRLLSTRQGIMLIAIKANTESGKFSEEVQKIFPGLSERTRSYCMGLGTHFLEEQGVAIAKDVSADEAKRLCDAWTLSQILTASNAKTSKGIADSPGDEEGNTGTNAGDKQNSERSPHVRIETYRQHLRRLNTAYAKVLSSTKRINPADMGKAHELVDRLELDELRPLLRLVLEGRSAKLEEGSDPAVQI
jgi:hypothetical protein